MAHDTISTAEERKLFDAVKQASDLIAHGLTPDAAVEKVAREHAFGPGKIRVISHALNTGTQTAQWQGGGSILDKLASYPLADPEAVIQTIYGEEKSAAAVDDYTRPPSWLRTTTEPGLTKQASYQLPAPTPPPVDPMIELHRAYAIADRNKKAVDECSRRVSRATDNVRSKVAALVDYFKQAGHSRLPFALVETAARTYFGQAAEPLLDLAYKQAHLKEKRASAELSVSKAVNLQTAPFSIVQACIKAAEDCHSQHDLLTRVKTEAARVKEAAFRPFVPLQERPPPVSPMEQAAADLLKTGNWSKEVAAIATGDIIGTVATHPSPKPDEDPYDDVKDIDSETSSIADAADKALKAKQTEKTAVVGNTLLAAYMGSAMNRTLGESPKTKNDLVDDAVMELDDPEHQNELRKIRAHAMLNQMLTDPDDPISGHDHHRVLHAYNEINQMSPRVAETSATLRPILRKRLEGHIEPFEVKEIGDIEKGLQASRAPAPRPHPAAAPAQ